MENKNQKVLITGSQLMQICKSLSTSRSNELASIMQKVLPVYSMYDIRVIPEFIAQISHESQEFSAKAENLNYTAQQILNTWPLRFKTISDASPFSHNPKLLANKVYNGRMGNRLNSDDGWNFRGSGFMQNTGKDSITPYFNFKKAGKGFKMQEEIKSEEDVVNLLRTNDVWALDAACWEFAISKSLIDEAINDDFLKITKAINGGTIGMPSRQMYYNLAKIVFKQ